jgi:hypothetical protein
VQHTSIAHRRRWAAAVAASGLALVVALAAASPAAARASGLKPMAARDAVAAMEAGTTLDHREIQGIVHLKNANVDKPFECTSCQFDGPVLAENAVFGRLVNFAGSTFNSSVKMNGATFVAPALFGSPSVDSSFAADADFTLATFGDLADFERTAFAGAATFVLTRFRGDAIFAGERPPCEGQNDRALFNGETTFERASFAAAADFRERFFSQSPDFRRASFSGRTDFSSSCFPNGAKFNWSRLGSETTFLAAMLGTNASAETAVDNVHSAGSVDFTAAQITGTLLVTNSDFGALSFADAVFDRGQLYLETVRAPDFFIDIGSIPSVLDTDRKTALSLLEASAKAKDDLALANDAHYQLQSLKSNDYWGPVHVLDAFFYGLIAGYLVRPDHPLFTLLALALLVSLIRVLLLVPEPSVAHEARRIRLELRLKLRKGLDRFGASIRIGPWLEKRFWPGLKLYGHELLDTLKLIWPRSAATATGRRLEAFAYRVLFVCMLFGFANSNPTLRQMLDALL